jgi:hypothetical protein
MPISLEGVRPNEAFDVPVSRAVAPEQHAEPERFERLLRRLAHEIDHGEAIVGAGMRGHYEGLDAGQLIALQAGIYRYSEAVDLTVKIVDRATSGTKTILESGR